MKPITLKGRRGLGRGFLSSCLPNHDDKSLKEKENKNQGQTALERVKAQQLSTNYNLYDACNECTYDACSNAKKLVQFLIIYQQLT